MKNSSNKMQQKQQMGQTKQTAAAPPNQLNVIETVDELSELMKNDPGGIDEDLVAKGEALIGTFADENYTTRRFPDLNAKKIEIIKRTIEDISMGVMILRTSTLGLTVRANSVEPYIIPHGNLPNGNVIFSLNWKNIVAFKNWRSGESDPVSQDDINAAIYMLTVEISRLLVGAKH